MFLHINNTIAILLKTTSLRVSSIQIMQVRVQNKGKSVWKSIYDGDVSLANYTFKDGVPKKLGDPGIPTIPCSIKNNYVKTALCDLGAGVSVMPFSLYKRLDLNKLTPTEISLLEIFPRGNHV